MTRACSSYTSTLTYLTLALASWLRLCFHGKALSALEAVIEVLLNLYKQTTVTSTFET